MTQRENPSPDTRTPDTQTHAERIEREILDTPLSPEEKRGPSVDWQFLVFALIGSAILMVLMIL